MLRKSRHKTALLRSFLLFVALSVPHLLPGYHAIPLDEKDVDLCDSISQNTKELEAIRAALKTVEDYYADIPGFADRIRLCLNIGYQPQHLVEIIIGIAEKVRGNEGEQSVVSLQNIQKTHPSYPLLIATFESMIINQSHLLSPWEVANILRMLTLGLGEKIHPGVLPVLREQALHAREPIWIGIWEKGHFGYNWSDEEHELKIDLAPGQVGVILLLTPMESLPTWSEGMKAEDLTDDWTVLFAIIHSIAELTPAWNAPVTDYDPELLSEERLVVLMRMAMSILAADPELICDPGPGRREEWTEGQMGYWVMANAVYFGRLLRLLRHTDPQEAVNIEERLRLLMNGAGLSEEARVAYEGALEVAATDPAGV